MILRLKVIEGRLCRDTEMFGEMEPYLEFTHQVGTGSGRV
jgi:hypothetical protein